MDIVEPTEMNAIENIQTEDEIENSFLNPRVLRITKFWTHHKKTKDRKRKTFWHAKNVNTNKNNM